MKRIKIKDIKPVAKPDKKKGKTLEDKWIGLPKMIYTEPMRVNTDASGKLPSNTLFHQIDDKKIVLNLGTVDIIEFCFACCLVIVFSWVGVLEPISKYCEKIAIYNIEYAKDNGENTIYTDEEKRIEYLPDGLWRDENGTLKGVASGNSKGKIEILTDEEMRLYQRQYLDRLEHDADVQMDIGQLILASCSVLCFMYYMYVTSKRVADRLIFDREKSLIIYRYNYGLCSRVVPFNDTLLQVLPWNLLRSDKYYLVMRFPKIQSFARVSMGLPFMFGSLYVWYMDKNRPLPPGTVFDKYRENDYLRRRADGFPDPLYPSSLNTIEWEGAVGKYNDHKADRRYDAFFNPKIYSVVHSEPSYHSIYGRDGQNETL